jgi:hypothetical protein
MANCKKYNRMFEKALYGELNAKDLNKLKLHFEECDSCKNEYLELNETLELYKNTDLVEPNPIFMNKLLDNLLPELENINNSKSSVFVIISKIKNWFYIQPKWTYQLATSLSLIIIGIFIGRFYFESNSIKENIVAEKKSDKNNIVLASEVKAARYLDRSKVLLLGLVNMDTDVKDIEPSSFQQQKRISRELVTVAAELRKELSIPSQRRLKELVSDLEVILLQIANIESEYDLSWIDLVKSGVDKRGIFLKINIQKMNNTSSGKDVRDVSSEITNKNI